MELARVTAIGEVLQTALNSTNTKTSTAVAKAKDKSFQKAEERPQFLTEQHEIEQYEKTDLDFKSYLRIMAELEGIKRDHFERLTIQLWYREFIRMGWRKEKFIEQANKVKTNKKFGKVDFNDFLADEKVYSDEEIMLLVHDRIKSKISGGFMFLDLLKKGFALTPDELLAAGYEASDKLELEYETERREAYEKEVLREMEKGRARLEARRKMIKKLALSQRLHLVNECMRDGILEFDTSPSQMNTYMHYTELFADLIPESYIKQASETLDTGLKEKDLTTIKAGKANL